MWQAYSKKHCTIFVRNGSEPLKYMIYIFLNLALSHKNQTFYIKEYRKIILVILDFLKEAIFCRILTN